jgi:succinate dehydrogenase hydrophobic anchor subunit
MRHGFQRKQMITRVPALVLVVLLFWIAVFVAIHQAAR